MLQLFLLRFSDNGKSVNTYLHQCSHENVDNCFSGEGAGVRCISSAASTTARPHAGKKPYLYK